MGVICPDMPSFCRPGLMIVKVYKVQTKFPNDCSYGRNSGETCSI